MLLDIHHLVSDGTSYLVLFPQRDLPLAYEGKPLQAQEYGILQAAEDEAASIGNEEYHRAKAVMAKKYAGVDLATLSARPENPVGEMAQVGNAIRKQHELLTGQEINTLLEWNAGNHFVDSDKRMAKGFAWTIKSL